MDSRCKRALTGGCIRCYDDDILDIKIRTDQLEADDAEESPGTVTVTNTLKKYRGQYYTPEDYATIQENLSNSTNITGGLLRATSPQQARELLRASVVSYVEATEDAADGVEGIGPDKKTLDGVEAEPEVDDGGGGQ